MSQGGQGGRFPCELKGTPTVCPGVSITPPSTFLSLLHHLHLLLLLHLLHLHHHLLLLVCLLSENLSRNRQMSDLPTRRYACKRRGKIHKTSHCDTLLLGNVTHKPPPTPLLAPPLPPLHPPTYKDASYAVDT